MVVVVVQTVCVTKMSVHERQPALHLIMGAVSLWTRPPALHLCTGPKKKVYP